MAKTLYLTAVLLATVALGIYLIKRADPAADIVRSAEQLSPNATSSPSANPLLTATINEFNRWLPPYCGPDLYLSNKTKKHTVDVCVEGTIQRVNAATGIALKRAQVLDENVKAHWKKTMGATK